MVRITIMYFMLASCLLSCVGAMGSVGVPAKENNRACITQLGESVLNKQGQQEFQKDWNKKRMKEQADREKFWTDQFGADSAAKQIPAPVQRLMVKNFILPLSEVEKARKTLKYCLPLAVRGLTPALIEEVEKNLTDFYMRFKADHIKKHDKEPNSLIPTIIACADPHGRFQEVIGENPSSVQAFARCASTSLRVVTEGLPHCGRMGNTQALIYSDCSIEWIIDESVREKIATFSADTKVLAAQLYKKDLQASKKITVQLGRNQTVHDQYNGVFFGDPNRFMKINLDALENFKNVQTIKSKQWCQLIRGITFLGNTFCGWLGYRLFFKNRTYQWNNPAYGMVGMIGLSCIAAHFIQATKALVGGLINAR